MSKTTNNVSTRRDLSNGVKNIMENDSNFCILLQKKVYQKFQFLHFYMIFYTPFDTLYTRSRRVLTLFVVFDIEQTYICKKN